MFKKILIANRGEIAVRVIRACREMGIATVAVYSEADRGALHVRMADEAFEIGPAPPQSYLVIEKIIDAARRSERGGHSSRLRISGRKRGIRPGVPRTRADFYWTVAESIALDGIKVESRRGRRNTGGDPCPEHWIRSARMLKRGQIAASIGYPDHAQGFRRRRRQRPSTGPTATELESALRTTRSEAMAAFGDDAIYIEKFVEKPRHIEIQVLADHHGNAIYLGERECTIQRRHQKVIEECPSPIVDAGSSTAHGRGGAEGGPGARNTTTPERSSFSSMRTASFYFLEMNTRASGGASGYGNGDRSRSGQTADRIAAGEQLALRQEDITMRGSAIECRVYAEDPGNNFFPSPGKITAPPPALGPRRS